MHIYHRLVVVSLIALLVACGVPERADQPAPTATANADTMITAPPSLTTASAAPALLAGPYPAPTATTRPYPLVISTPTSTTPTPTWDLRMGPYPGPTPSRTPTVGPPASVASLDPLLRDVWPTPAHPTTNLTLFYAEDTTDHDQSGPNFTLWKVAVPNGVPEQLWAIPSAQIEHPFDHLQGSIAPDGQWLAYELRSDVNILRVVRQDGTDSRVLAGDLASGDIYAADFTFYWSPDSQHLIFDRYYDNKSNEQSRVLGIDYGKDLYIYDVASGQQRRVFRTGYTVLGGWIDADHVLLISESRFPGPVSLIALDINTGSHKIILPEVGGARIGAFSHDRRAALVFSTSPLIVDLQAKTVRSLGQFRDFQGFLWSVDDRALLISRRAMSNRAMSNSAMLYTEVILAEPPYSRTRVNLSTGGWEQPLRFMSVSPDGQYLVVCENIDSERDSYPSYIRTMIYDVAADHWQVMKSGGCLGILGWATH